MTPETFKEWVNAVAYALGVLSVPATAAVVLLYGKLREKKHETEAKSQVIETMAKAIEVTDAKDVKRAIAQVDLTPKAQAVLDNSVALAKVTKEESGGSLARVSDVMNTVETGTEKKP